MKGCLATAKGKALDPIEQKTEQYTCATDKISRCQWTIVERVRTSIGIVECGRSLIQMNVIVGRDRLCLIVRSLFNSFPLTLGVKAACFVLAIEVLLRVLTLICACPIFKANFSHYKFSNANLRHF